MLRGVSRRARARSLVGGTCIGFMGLPRSASGMSASASSKRFQARSK